MHHSSDTPRNLAALPAWPQFFAKLVRYYEAGWNVGGAIAANLLALALPIFMLQVYDRIVLRHSSETLAVLAGGLVIALVLDHALRLARHYAISWEASKFEYKVSQALHQKVFGSDFVALPAQSASAFVQQMHAPARLKDLHGSSFWLTLVDLPFAAIFIGLLYALGGWLVAVPLVLTTMFIGVMWHQVGTARRLLVLQQNHDDARYESIRQNLTAIHTLKALGGEQWALRGYEHLATEAAEYHYHLSQMNSKAANYSAIFAQAMTAAVITVGTPMAYEGKLTMGALIACVMLASRLVQPVQRLLGLSLRWQEGQLALEQLRPIVQLPGRKLASPPPERTGQVQIKTLSHGDLRNLNLDLQLGDSIYITGGSEAQKTQFLQLCAGLITPERGQLWIDGRPIYRLASEALAKHIAYLPAQGEIFQGTIRDNLTRFGQIPFAAMQELLALFGFDQEIAKLPHGYETVLEDTTADPLSPGLKQRLALIRALAQKPRVILFDQADRALDKAGYAQLHSLLGRLQNRVTMLLVTEDQNLQRLARQRFDLITGQLSNIETKAEPSFYHVQAYQHIRTIQAPDMPPEQNIKIKQKGLVA